MDDLHERYERELANDLGNLVSRTTAMIARYRGGSLGANAWDSPLRADLDALGPDVAARLDDWDLSGALDRIWETVRALNRHVEETAPWQLAKDDARADELDRTLYDLADGLRSVAVAVAPYLPESAPRILAALGQPERLDWDLIGYGKSAAAEGIEPAQPLFPRVESAAPAA